MPPGTPLEQAGSSWSRPRKTMLCSTGYQNPVLRVRRTMPYSSCHRSSMISGEKPAILGFRKPHFAKGLMYFGIANNECKKHYVDLQSLDMTTCLQSDNGITTLKGLKPILSCIHNLQESQSVLQGCKERNSLSLNLLKNEISIKNEDEFCFVVSLQDGTTLHATSSATSILGYPEEVMLGECIMKFLYPADCVAFAEHLTVGLNHYLLENEKGNLTQDTHTFFCRIRRYQDSSYEKSKQKANYLPFLVTTHVASLACVDKNSVNLCLIASVVPVVSAYKVPGEIPAMTFSTRHTVSCHFSHIDTSAVPYLGFLPQDMIGYSIFDFYHVDDMPQLKDVYELVVKEQGCSFRSKPYRFRAFNGCYITVETEWSCFINPWSHKLEFVVGQHRVLKGPKNIEVFKECNKETTFADEILKESQRIQEEIKNILAQPVKPCCRSKRHNDKWKRDLTSKINCLIDDVKKGRNAEKDQDGYEGCSCSSEDPTIFHFDDFYERSYHEVDKFLENDSKPQFQPCKDQGSVLMGEISPHQEFNDSDPLSETPPSFQEMRYQENIERFFASHPKTYSSDGSGGSKCEERQTQNIVAVEKDKRFNHCKKASIRYENRAPPSSAGSSKWKMSSGTTEDSGNGSLMTKDGIQPNDSSSGSSSRGSGDSSCDNYPPCPTLTEQTLSQHNRMSHKHMKQRKNISSSSGAMTRKESHRLKRSGGSTQSCERLPGAHKHVKTNRSQGVSTVTVPTQTDGSLPFHSFNMSSPFSLPAFPLVAQPPSSHATTITTSSSSICSSSVPSIALPVYGYPTTNNTSATPLFMPVMCMGAVPFYPSISTVVPHSGQWPCDEKKHDQQSSLNDGLNFNNNSNHKSYGEYCLEEKLDCSNDPIKPLVDGNMLKTTGNKMVVQTCDVKPIIKENIASQNHVVPNSHFDSNKHLGLCSTKYEDGANISAINIAPSFSMDNTDTKKEPDDKIVQKCKKETEPTEKDQEDTTLSCISSSLKSDDSSSHSPSDQAEDMELDTKEDACKLPGLSHHEPPWMEGVKMDTETMFRYQIEPVNMDEILRKDLEALQSMQQPKLVNKQLACLQSDLEDEMNLNDDVMALGFTTEDDINEDAENEEQNILQLIAGDS